MGIQLVQESDSGLKLLLQELDFSHKLLLERTPNPRLLVTVPAVDNQGTVLRISIVKKAVACARGGVGEKASAFTLHKMDIEKI